MNPSVKLASIAALETAGVANAYALAACCALPLLLVSLGLSPY